MYIRWGAQGETPIQYTQEVLGIKTISIVLDSTGFHMHKNMRYVVLMIREYRVGSVSFGSHGCFRRVGRRVTMSVEVEVG